jgi:hypothetical protein
MKRIKTRIPTHDEYAAMILGIDLDIIEVREGSDGDSYVLPLGESLIEVPGRAWWRIREETECQST